MALDLAHWKRRKEKKLVRMTCDGPGIFTTMQARYNEDGDRMPPKIDQLTREAALEMKKFVEGQLETINEVLKEMDELEAQLDKSAEV